MNFLKKNLNGILVCFVIAVPSWLLGKTFPVVGGPVIAILAGMLITLVWTNKGKAESGIKWTWIRNEPWRHLTDRKTVTPDHRMYHQYFPDHRMAAP